MSTSPRKSIVRRPCNCELAAAERERLHVIASRLSLTADLLEDEHLHAIAVATRNRAYEVHAIATGDAVAES